jgi:hypothetical protein
MSRFAFGLPYFLFGLGSALNTGEHVIWSICLIQNCQRIVAHLTNALVELGHEVTLFASAEAYTSDAGSGT